MSSASWLQHVADEPERRAEGLAQRAVRLLPARSRQKPASIHESPITSARNSSSSLSASSGSCATLARLGLQVGPDVRHAAGRHQPDAIAQGLVQVRLVGAQPVQELVAHHGHVRPARIGAQEQSGSARRRAPVQEVRSMRRENTARRPSGLVAAQRQRRESDQPLQRLSNRSSSCCSNSVKSNAWDVAGHSQLGSLDGSLVGLGRGGIGGGSVGREVGGVNAEDHVGLVGLGSARSLPVRADVPLARQLDRALGGARRALRQFVGLRPFALQRWSSSVRPMCARWLTPAATVRSRLARQLGRSVARRR